jgi:hypothetical protein
MSAESTLYGWLSNYAPLIALVGDRIHPGAIPADVDLPAIAFARQGTDPINTVSGLTIGEFASMSIQCWAANQTTADPVADQVIAALNLNGEVHTNRAVFVNEETGNVGTAIDVQMLT